MDLTDPIDAASISAELSALPRLTGATCAVDEGELPLTVWLRGDEPFVTDFSLEAEQVMGELGIRRSRLTQISGKELRVGRIRRGRVVIAVYRPEDVASYRAWTRATASHVKSSAILNEAAASLRDEGHRVSNAIQQLGESLALSTQQAVQRGISEILRVLHTPIQEMSATFAADAAVKTHLMERTQAQIAAQAEHIAVLQQRLDFQASALMVITREVSELTSLARLARDDAAMDRSSMADALQDLAERLTSLKTTQDAASQRARRPEVKRDRAAARHLARLSERDRDFASGQSSPQQSARRSSRWYRATRRRPPV